MNTLTVRAIRATQANDVSVYSFFLTGKDVLNIADISRIHRDQNNELKGFQRPAIQHHVNSIIEYLNQGSVLFPNALILALQRNVEFKQSRGPSPDGAVSGTLILKIHSEKHKPAWIVDGQQRALALKGSENSNIMVPVIAFVAKDIESQREQFILVNKARPLSKRLINELLPELTIELPADLKPAKIPSEICNLLHQNPDSPFYGIIKRTSNKNTEKDAIVSDNAIIQLIKNSINNHGVLSFYKSNLEDGISDIEAMYQVLCTFWSAVKIVFPYAWGKDPSESRLMHSAGILAMGILMDKLMPRFLTNQNCSEDVISALKSIEPYCNWTEGRWEGINKEWNEIQNIPKHIKSLADYLIQLDFHISQEKLSK